MPIQTASLNLRCFTEDDFDLLRELDGDPVVLCYRFRQLISPDMTRGFLDWAQKSVNEQPRLFYAYAIVQRDSPAWLGQCGLTVLDHDATEADAWYSLLPRYWGHGYMSEALQALLYTGGTEFKLQRIFAEAHVDNHASIRVMEKVGIRYEGRVQIAGEGGGIEEHVRYGLASSEVKDLSGAHLRIVPPL